MMKNLRKVSAAGHGFYEQAGYTDGDVRRIMARMEAQEDAGQATATGHTTRVWQEHFYLLVLAMGLLALPWFRRGYALPVMAFLAVFLAAPQNASAAVLQDYFLNHDQQGRALLSGGDYRNAETRFTSPYRRGIAQYRAGNYAAAEKSFNEAQGSVPQAQYNMANAQVMEGKYEDAIGAYEAVLKRNPKDANAQHNLDIARKLLEQKKQEQQKQNKHSSDKDQKQGKQPSSSQGSSQRKDKNTRQNNQNGNSGSGSQQEKQGKKQNAAQQEDSNKSAQNGDGQKNQKTDENGQRKPASPQNPAQDDAAAQETQGGSPSGNQRQSPTQKPNAQGVTQSRLPPESSQNKQAGAARHANGLPGTSLHGADEVATDQAHSHTQADINADRWLNRIDNDPQSFLKNQFLIESERNKTTQGDEPW